LKPDDIALVADALEGGPERFGPIVERYRDAVFGVALARLGNFHDTEDTAQGVFVEAFQRLSTLKKPERLGAWLRSITIHRAIDAVRRRRETGDVDDIQESYERDSAAAERQELRDRVMNAIAALSNAQRETTTLFYINGYSVEEVAAIQEAPVGTVKRRLHDARKKLKEDLMEMAEEVLKANAPKEDFAERVYDLIYRFRPRGDEPRVGWHEVVEELKKIGAKGIDGFIKAYASPYYHTRIGAVRFLMADPPAESRELVIEMLKKGLEDTNKKIRRFAAGALLEIEVDDQRKREESVPLVVPLLNDRSKFTRRAAAWHLLNWTEAVPLAAAARSLLDEDDHHALHWKKGIVRAILDAQEAEDT